MTLILPDSVPDSVPGSVSDSLLMRRGASLGAC